MNDHPTDYGPEPSVASLLAEIFRLEGEIERLRRADPALRNFIEDTPYSEPNDGWGADAVEQPLRQMDVAQRALVNATIERCAQVADKAAEKALEEYQRCKDSKDAAADYYLWCHDEAVEIAAAIRKLKDA